MKMISRVKAAFVVFMSVIIVSGGMVASVQALEGKAGEVIVKVEA